MNREELHRDQEDQNDGYSPVSPNNGYYHDNTGSGKYQNHSPYHDNTPYRRHHRGLWTIIIIIIAVLVGGASYKIHEDNMANNQPKVENNKKVNNTTNYGNNQHQQPSSRNDNNQAAMQAHQAYKDENTLRNELKKIGIQSKENSQLMNAYERLNSAEQIQTYNTIQRINKRIPSNILKRKAVQKCLGRQAKQNANYHKMAAQAQARAQAQTRNRNKH